jgi:hypothetical protein
MVLTLGINGYLKVECYELPLFLTILSETMIMTKKCKGCLVYKAKTEFSYAPENADRLKGKCKDCVRIGRRTYLRKVGNGSYYKYEKTKNGFLMRLYRNMKSRVEGIQKEKHKLYVGKELLEKNCFYEWAMSQSEFHELFSIWETSGYERRLTPSVDRIKSEIGYVVGNMEFVTHSENSRRGALAKGRKVFDTSTGIQYKNIPEASKATGIPYHNLFRYLTNERANKTTLILIE